MGTRLDTSPVVSPRTRSFGSPQPTTSTNKTGTDIAHHPSSEVPSIPKKTSSKRSRSSASHELPSSRILSTPSHSVTATLPKSTSLTFTSKPNQSKLQTLSPPSPCPSPKPSKNNLLGFGKSNPGCASSKPDNPIQSVAHATSTGKTVAKKPASSSETSNSKKTTKGSTLHNTSTSQVQAASHPSSASSRHSSPNSTPRPNQSQPQASKDSQTLSAPPACHGQPNTACATSNHIPTVTVPLPGSTHLQITGKKSSAKKSPSPTLVKQASTHQTARAGPKTVITSGNFKVIPTSHHIHAVVPSSSLTAVNGPPPAINNTGGSPPIAIDGSLSPTTNMASTAPISSQTSGKGHGAHHTGSRGGVNPIIWGSIASVISTLVLASIFLAFRCYRRKIRRDLKEQSQFKQVRPAMQADYVPVEAAPFSDRDGSVVRSIQKQRRQIVNGGVYDTPTAYIGYPYAAQSSRSAQNHASVPSTDLSSTTTYHTMGSPDSGYYREPADALKLVHTNESKTWDDLKVPGNDHHTQYGTTNGNDAHERLSSSNETAIGIAM